MFNNDGHLMVLKEGDKFQVYIWSVGMKFKLQVCGGGFDDKEEAEQTAEMAAQALKIPFNKQ